MKTHFLLIFALAAVCNAQSNRPQLSPEQAAPIQAIRDAKIQRVRAERSANIQKTREAGRKQARATRAGDREFIAVWSGLDTDVRKMYAARELVERISRREEWKNQTRAQRIASVTAFITNYPSIKAARDQKAMSEAIGTPMGVFPAKLDAIKLAGELEANRLVIPDFEQSNDPAKLAASLPAPEIDELPEADGPVELAASLPLPEFDGFPKAEIPDLFTINRRFNWSKPHGQWMNQMLKDIDAAKTSGDIETYESLTKRYTAWADQYLRDDR